MRSSWYISFKDDSGAIFCHIHRAMMRAFYKEYLGMERPAGKWRMFRVVLKDSHDEENAGFFNRFRVMGLWPDITIYAKNSLDNYKPAEDIIKTTSHELGHATHFKISSLYKKTDKTIKESWASAVGMYVLEEEYYRLSPDDYLDKLYTYTSYPQPNPHTGPATRTVGVVPFMDPSFKNKQAWPFVDKYDPKLYDKLQYSPLFIDLVDSSNQQLYFNFIKLGDVYGTPGYWKDVPYDDIQGISMDRIQWAVAKSCDFESLSRSLKIIAAEAGYSADEIDWYLEYYKKYWVKK